VERIITGFTGAASVGVALYNPLWLVFMAVFLIAVPPLFALATYAAWRCMGATQEDARDQAKTAFNRLLLLSTPESRDHDPPSLT